MMMMMMVMMTMMMMMVMMVMMMIGLRRPEASWGLLHKGGGRGGP